VISKQGAPSTNQNGYTRFSDLPASEKEEAVEGLDVAREIRAVDSQRLRDTILLLDGSRVTAFGVCHIGSKTEAGSGSCYVKFAAVRPGASAGSNFERLLNSCEAYAVERSVARLDAGVNMGRNEAYRIMIGRGFPAPI
jgi:hypothetical protein